MQANRKRGIIRGEQERGSRKKWVKRKKRGTDDDDHLIIWQHIMFCISFPSLPFLLPSFCLRPLLPAPMHSINARLPSAWDAGVTLTHTRPVAPACICQSARASTHSREERERGRWRESTVAVLTQGREAGGMIARDEADAHSSDRTGARDPLAAISGVVAHHSRKSLSR